MISGPGQIDELLAERGAAFRCADLDLMLEPREDHAAYIANWLDADWMAVTPPEMLGIPTRGAG